MANEIKILMVVTSHAYIDETHPTGLWLEEFALPYGQFLGAGFEVTVASPQGGPTPIDPRSTPDSQKASEWAEAIAVLKTTRRLEEVEARDYAAIFLPGGHGTMYDLPDNKRLGQLLSEFAEADKVIAAVCHGPAGLVGATRRDGTPIVAGKTLTAFTDEEERAAQLDTLMPFLLQSRLTALGGRFVARPNWADHVEQDGQLITGQNPQSSASVAQAVVAALRLVLR